MNMWKVNNEGLIELPKIINSETIWNWSGEQEVTSGWGVQKEGEKGWYEQVSVEEGAGKLCLPYSKPIW